MYAEDMCNCVAFLGVNEKETHDGDQVASYLCNLIKNKLTRPMILHTHSSAYVNLQEMCKGEPV